MDKIRLLVADDHQVVRKGIFNLLEDDPQFELVGEAANGAEVLEKLKQAPVDVVLLDISMPVLNGIETAHAIQKEFSSTKTIIFSMHHNEDYILKSVENGAWGYLLKDSSKEELTDAILSVAHGEKYFNKQISNTLLDALATKPKKVAKRAQYKITSKEKVILSYLIFGLSSREIAEKLKLSIRTVDNHRASLMRKTSTKNAVELVRLAIEEQLTL